MKYIISFFVIILTIISNTSFAGVFINTNKSENFSDNLFLDNMTDENNVKNYKLIEGDILEKVYNKNNFSAPLNYSKHHWNNGIIYYSFKLFTHRNKYYKIRNFNQHEIDIIRHAMNELEKIADIKFIEVHHKPNHNYLEIMIDTGCFSGIGADYPQTVSLGEGCVYPHIIQHELMHALGFLHEQSRADRHYYVRINKENIIPGKENNFELGHNSTVQFGMYDYYSIMHYALNAFSKDPRKLTIEPILSGVYWHYIGNVRNLSELDKYALQRAYDKANYK